MQKLTYELMLVGIHFFDESIMYEEIVQVDISYHFIINFSLLHYIIFILIFYPQKLSSVFVCFYTYFQSTEIVFRVGIIEESNFRLDKRNVQIMSKLGLNKLLFCF